jgi:hypothetical protein
MSELCSVVSHVISFAAVDLHLQHIYAEASEVYKISSNQISKYLFFVLLRFSLPVL